MTLCDTLVSTVDEHPNFSGALLQVVRAQVRAWASVPNNQRPDFHCLETVWMRERRQAADAAGARPEDVAALLEVLITEGGISPFEGLTAGNAGEHLLTSRRASSRDLRRRLRTNLGIVAGTGVGEAPVPSVFVRAIALDFGWTEPLPNDATLEVLAERAAPPDLLTGYRIASALSGNRIEAGGARDTNLRAVAEGILSCLRSQLSSNALQGDDAKLARRVIRVIELERVVRGMVELLNARDASGQGVHNHEVEAWFASHRAQDGPLAHLRQYALGEPLITLLGGVADTEVRREIERVMEALDEGQVPGFPSIASTSRRPSDLLRRIRFLVRAMVIRSLERGSQPICRNFVHRLFGGAHEHLTLAAAKLAFERPVRDAAQAIVRSDVENLVELSGVWSGAPTESHDLLVRWLLAHEILVALKVAVSIEVDSWSAERDNDSPSLLTAIKGVLEQLEQHYELEEGVLVQHVFDRAVCARAREEHRFNRGPDRRQFWHDLESLHGDIGDTLAGAVGEGLASFKSVIRDNFHREFDRSRLRQIAVDLVDNDEGGSIDWLKSWAYVEADGPAPSSAASRLQGRVAGDLVRDARAQPADRQGTAGESWVFRLADAAAHGHQAARDALLSIAHAEDARVIFQSVLCDATGRSLGVAIAQTCDAELVNRLFGPNRAFDLPLKPSVDLVTPVMAAARFAKDGNADAMRGFRAVLDCQPGTSINARDRRGWRAVHHAFAAGNVEAVRELVRRDADTAGVQDGDTTTFLIEAFRGASGAVDGAAVLSCARDLLHGMGNQDRARVLGFRGPRTLEGMPLSVVSAVLSVGQHWHELMTLVEAYPAQAEAVWAGVGSPTMRNLLDHPDPIQLAQFCRCVAGVSREVLRELVGGMDVPLSIRVARGARSRSKVESAKQKFMDLSRFDLLDIAATSAESGGTMFHELVDSVAEARQAAGDSARDADAYGLAVSVISLCSAPHVRAALLKSDYDSETAVWQASRRGEVALALAYARALGWPADGDGQLERWTRAAQFLVSPDRYQDGVPRSHRVRINAQRHLEMALQSDAPFQLSQSPVPAEMDVRTAREWLKTHSLEVANAIQDRIGAQNRVQTYDFVNWISHLAEERN